MTFYSVSSILFDGETNKWRFTIRDGYIIPLTSGVLLLHYNYLDTGWAGMGWNGGLGSRSLFERAIEPSF
jgi:hypothetical protein